MKERFESSKEYWCQHCKIPWRIRIVNPPGGCLETHCHKCNREWNMAVTWHNPSKEND